MKYVDFDNSFCKECDAGLEGGCTIKSVYRWMPKKSIR